MTTGNSHWSTYDCLNPTSDPEEHGLAPVHHVSIQQVSTELYGPSRFYEVLGHSVQFAHPQAALVVLEQEQLGVANWLAVHPATSLVQPHTQGLLPEPDVGEPGQAVQVLAEAPARRPCC